MNNKIVLEPFGGLANRMRVITSGLWLGKLTQKEVKLIWNIDAELNCPFEELFESIQNLEIINKKNIYRFLRTVKSESTIKKLIRKYGRLYFAQNYVIFEDEIVRAIRAGKLDILNFSKITKNMYFITCEGFAGNFDALNLFVPKPDIRSRIEEQSQRFNNKTHGIHIRRTDHDVAVRNSPTSLFTERIIADLKRDPDINYFLSTDDHEIEKQFKSQFGKKILTIEKEYSRNTPDGIKDALVDFYCLANTQKIYGSYWSSFSQLAARINSIKNEKLKITE